MACRLPRPTDPRPADQCHEKARTPWRRARRKRGFDRMDGRRYTLPHGRVIVLEFFQSGRTLMQPLRERTKASRRLRSVAPKPAALALGALMVGAIACSAWAQAPAPEALPAAGAPVINALLPRDLSPWGMFLNADIVVKIVMIGLVFASLVTWTVWLAKSLELWRGEAQRARSPRRAERGALARRGERAARARPRAGGAAGAHRACTRCSSLAASRSRRR